MPLKTTRNYNIGFQNYITTNAHQNIFVLNHLPYEDAVFGQELKVDVFDNGDYIGLFSFRINAFFEEFQAIFLIFQK